MSNFILSFRLSTLAHRSQDANLVFVFNCIYFLLQMSFLPQWRPAVGMN